MSHNLFTEHGRAHMMYTGDPPWHGLGKRLDHPATSAEALRAAGLDWDVITVPLQTAGQTFLDIPDRRAVVPAHRWGEPDCPVFGVVGASYRPLQNREAFAFCDGLVQAGAAIYHTAGALGQGQRVWILAKLPEAMHVAKGDDLDKYLLLSTGHDGRTSVQVRFTPVRVVCQNTLNLALRGAAGWRAWHNADLPRRMEAVKRSIALVRKTFTAAEEVFKAMTGVQLTTVDLTRYLGQVFPDPPVDHTGRLGRAVQRDRLGAAWRFEAGLGNRLPGVRGTLWAAYNGVTEWVDHARSNLRGQDRLSSLWFGRGAQIKAHALAVARAWNRAQNN